MSGRKASEVAAILKQSEEIQNEIFGKYSSKIETVLKNINLKNSNMIEVQNNLKENKLAKSNGAETEFKNEYSNLEDKFNSIKKENRENYVKIIEEINIKKNNINNEINSERDKAHRLRKEIQNKSHYCDNEYLEAEKIKGKIDKCKKSFLELFNEIDKLNDKVSKEQEKTLKNETILKNIRHEIDNLEERAKKIKEMRDKASELKESIRKEKNLIESEKAVKFENERYQELIKDVNSYSNMDDNGIIANYSSVIYKITDLKNSVMHKFSEWESNKKYNEKILKELKEKIEKKELRDIENEIFNRDEAKINIFEFLEKYSDIREKENIKKAMIDAESKYQQELFNESGKIIEKVNEKINELYFEAQNIREKIMSSFKLALKMRDIMDELGFETDLEEINGNYIDGFSLKCENGDIVNFDKIEVNENGVDIKIDHIEKTTGNCSIKWKDIQKKFQSEGIPMTDITKNGKSIIYGSSKKEADTSERVRGGI